MTDYELALETYNDFDIKHRELDIAMESTTLDEYTNLRALKESIELEFSKNVAAIFMVSSDVPYTATEQTLLENIAFRYMDVCENLGESIGDAKDKGKKGAKELSDKAKSKARDVKKEAEPKLKAAGKGLKNAGKKVADAIKALPSAFRSLVDNTYGRLKKMSGDQRKKELLEGGMYRKVSQLIKMGLRVGTSVALGPVLGSIFFVASIVSSSKANVRTQNQLLSDMKQELGITKEKIRDADSNGDKTAKYQLMRIKDQLERDIEKIEYGLDNYRATKNSEVK